jgi:hypothetical protein
MANPGTELAALDFGNLIGGPLNAVITAQAMAAQSTASFIKDVGFYQQGQSDADGNAIGGTPIYVDFKYPKEVSPYQPAIPAVAAVAAIPAVGNPAYPNGMAPLVPVANGAAVNPNDAAIAPIAGLPAYVPATPAVVGVAASPAVPAVYQTMQISVPILTMLPIPFIKVDILKIDFNAKITSMETQSQSSDLSVGVNLEVKQRWPGGSAKLNASVAYKKTTQSGSSVERTYSMAIHVQASQDEMPAGMEKLLGILEGAMISRPA